MPTQILEKPILRHQKHLYRIQQSIKVAAQTIERFADVFS